MARFWMVVRLASVLATRYDGAYRVHAQTLLPGVAVHDDVWLPIEQIHELLPNTSERRFRYNIASQTQTTN